MIYTLVTIVMWMINIILITLFVLMFVWIARLVYSVLRDRKHIEAISKKVDDEIAAEMKLPIEEAWKSAEIVLRERAQCEEWDRPPSQEITNLISKLDGCIQNLFGRYKKIWFSDNGTLISAELLLESTHSAGEYMVGKNDRLGDILTIRSGDSCVYEIYGTIVRAVYPSLIHYIAFIENDSYWD